MYYLKMRRWLTNLSQIIGSVLLLSLLTLVISSSFHKVSWVPEVIRSTLHLGEPESIIGPQGPVGPAGPSGTVAPYEKRSICTKLTGGKLYMYPGTCNANGIADGVEYVMLLALPF